MAGAPKLVAGDIIIVDDQAAIIDELRVRLEPHFGPIVCFVDPAEAIRHLLRTLTIPR